MSDNSYPAGWYPDTNAPGNDRYYDGTTWTAQTRPTAPAVPIAPVAPTVPTAPTIPSIEVVTSHASENNYAAGWYPDTNAPGNDRYYDGTNWTAQTRPTASTAPAASVAAPATIAEPAAKRKWYQRKAIVIPGAVIVFIFIIGIAASLGGGKHDTTAGATDDPAAAVTEDTPAPPIMETVPNVVGKTGDEAVTALEVAGLKADTGSGDLSMPVTTQSEAAASQVEKGTTVTLTLEAKPVYTVAQESAIRSAQSYLSFKGFSRAGLIGQLTSEYGEGFSKADAEFAVAALEKTKEVDWNQEAVESAKSYLEMKGFSRQGLFEQLTSAYGEQFTAAQANYALDQVGLK